MKIKKIKRGIVPMLLVALLLVCTSVIGVSAATQKTYLDTLLYSDFSTNTEEQGVNYMTKFDGSVYVPAIKGNHKCSNALYFNFSASSYDYTDEQEKFGPYMEVSYDIKNSNYKNFVSKLLCENSSHYCNVEVYGDGQCLFRQSVNSYSNIIDINLDVSKVSTFTIKLTQPVYSNYGHSNVYFDDAYFTSDGSTPEPTEKPTEKPTQAPTQAPTKPTVAPATEATTADDTKATTATDSTKATSSTNPTNVNPQTTPTSKVSTADTAKPTASNTTGTKGSTTGNGFVKTGDIPFIVLIALAVIGAGTGVVFFIRKKKFGK